MTTPTDQNPSPPPLPSATASRRFAFEPLPANASPLTIVDAVLKHPGRILHDLQNNWRATVAVSLIAVAMFGMAVYGLVVGSFSGGAQMWIAPAKLMLGTTLAALICLPSLYIFVCLSGIETHVGTVTGVLFGALAVAALLLIGFAPVAWIFSQSTESIAFMAGLHLCLWAIGILFGLRLVQGLALVARGSACGHLKLWAIIFVIVCLQMMTTLRPIIGRSDHFFPREKKFFIAHWVETMNGSR